MLVRLSWSPNHRCRGEVRQEAIAEIQRCKIRKKYERNDLTSGLTVHGSVELITLCVFQEHTSGAQTAD